MRLHLGAPPLSPDFDPERDGWSKLREPSPLWLQHVALPVAIVTATVLGFAWSRLTPMSSSGFSMTVDGRGGAMPSWLVGILGMAVVAGCFLALIAVHEFLHALAMPHYGLTRQTLIGVWPSRLLFYAAYLGPMPRNHFLWVFAVPFLVLSLVPLLGCMLLRIGPAAVVVVSVINGACACGDLLGIAMIAWQVPRDALVRNQGWQTWWLRAESNRIDRQDV
ncbi:MAG: DUF3267 domain-containing protein [Planctomycetaceae bacterium]|nr:DUF3267 domain-containing protein [Planctomycetaceae bacterium]